MKYEIGQETSLKVWAVDDAWFEGIERKSSIYDELELYLENTTTGTFDFINQKIRNRQSRNEEIGKVALDGEFLYLKLLLQLCSERGIQLILCNFEYFERNFNEMNVSRNIIFLDVQYDKCSDPATSNYYGISLIVNLLKEQKPEAEINFITGFPSQVQKVLDDHDWDAIFVRKFACIPKSSEKALQSFFKNIAPINHNECLRVFAKNLKRSHTEDFLHPNNIINDIPDDFLFKDKFANNEESFKALYYYDENTTTGKGDRNISLSVFIEHLKYASVNLSNINVDFQQIFRLPIQPGMIFVMWLVDFVHSLDASNIPQITIQATLSECIIEIPLKKNEAYTFREAVFTGGGQLTQCFRGLIACKKDILNKYLDEELTHEITDKWVYPKLLSELRSKIYKRLVDFNFDLDRSILVISWQYQIPNRSSSPERYFEE